jgi:hypothetical protein
MAQFLLVIVAISEELLYLLYLFPFLLLFLEFLFELGRVNFFKVLLLPFSLFLPFFFLFFLFLSQSLSFQEHLHENSIILFPLLL